MDNSRKNDSIATKTHPQKTAVNQQQTSVYDQNQQPGEMLAGHGMAATGAAIKTETTSATEKMSADHNIGVGGVQRDQSSVDTTEAGATAATSSVTSSDGNGTTGIPSTSTGTATGSNPATTVSHTPSGAAAAVEQMGVVALPTLPQPPPVSVLLPKPQEGPCTALVLMANVASLVDPPTKQPSLVPPAGGATSSSQMPASSSSKTVQRPAVFDKLESLVQDMQDKVHGVPVRHQKVFLTSIPFAFMGYDLIEWLMDRLSIEDSLEAVHLANLLCQFGYYFPIGELKNLLVKDDSSLYRFQSPYYWPSQHHTPDNIEYAIYLAKR
jgi:regulator of G-protein signaling